MGFWKTKHSMAIRHTILFLLLLSMRRIMTTQQVWNGKFMLSTTTRTLHTNEYVETALCVLYSCMKFCMQGSGSWGEHCFPLFDVIQGHILSHTGLDPLCCHCHAKGGGGGGSSCCACCCIQICSCKGCCCISFGSGHFVWRQLLLMVVARIAWLHCWHYTEFWITFYTPVF